MRTIGTALVALAALAALLPSAAAAEDALERALSLAAEERYTEARSVLDPLLERDPGNPRGRLLHGVLRAREGRRGEAVAIFSALVQDAPDMFEAHNNLAVLYVEQGRLEDALAVLLAILERRPEAAGYQNLGDIYARLARRAYARSAAMSGDRGGDRQPDAAAPAAARAETAPDAETPAPSGEQAGAPPRAAVDTAAEAGGVCVATAEFLDMGAVEDAQQWLKSRGAAIVRVSRGTRETVKNYRVYLPPFDSRKGAADKVRELRGQGIRDVAIVGRGDLKRLN